MKTIRQDIRQPDRARIRNKRDNHHTSTFRHKFIVDEYFGGSIEKYFPDEDICHY
jgi:hypothetical protein